MILDIAQAFFPNLDPDSSRRVLRQELSALKVRPLRRVAALATTLLMVWVSVPARATGMPTFDFAAWLQRESAATMTALNHAETESSSDYRWLRQVQASYNDAVWLRAQYAKLSGNVTFSVANLLPILPVPLVPPGQSSRNSFTLRPILDEGETLGRPRLNVHWKPMSARQVLGALNFDMSAIRTESPDVQKDPAQLVADSAADGWLVWKRVQTAEKIEEELQNIPNPNFPEDPYYSLRSRILANIQDRVHDLVAVAADASEMYGDEDPQVVTLRDKAADLTKALNAGAKADYDSLVDALNRIDDDAETSIRHYGYLRSELGFQAKRDVAKDENLAELAADDDGNDAPFSLQKYIEGTVDKFKGGQKREAAKDRQQTNHIAETQAQAYRLSLSEDLLREARTLQKLSNDKARTIKTALSAQEQKLASIKLEALRMKWAGETKAYLLSEPLQEIQIREFIPGVDGAMVNLIPGTVFQAPEAVAAKNVVVATNRAVENTQNLMRNWQSGYSSLGTGLVRSLLQGIDAAANTVFGRTFGLDNWSWALPKEDA